MRRLMDSDEGGKALQRDLDKGLNGKMLERCYRDLCPAFHNIHMFK